MNHYPQTLDSLPYQHGIEVAHLQVQPLILSSSQTKPHGEEHQGQRGHPREHEADRPQVKPARNDTPFHQSQAVKTLKLRTSNLHFLVVLVGEV